jgi:futalosine hydrolase
MPARGVLHLGIAGSFDLTAAPLGELVVATQEIWPEYGVRQADGTLTPLGFPMLDDVPEPVLRLDPDAAAQALGLSLPRQWIRGPALTGAGVTGDPVLAARLHRQWQAVTESMEGFGVALAARLAGVPFLEVRSISNAVGERDKRRWDVPAALAALAHATQTLFSPPS